MIFGAAGLGGVLGFVLGVGFAGGANPLHVPRQLYGEGSDFSCQRVDTLYGADEVIAGTSPVFFMGTPLPDEMYHGNMTYGGSVVFEGPVTFDSTVTFRGDVVFANPGAEVTYTHPAVCAFD